MSEIHKEIGEKLNALSEGKKSTWSEKARERKDNDTWLSESFSIALQVIDALDALGWNQKKLAEVSGVSAQRISKIILGRENLTLKTIQDLNKALNIKIWINVSELKREEQKLADYAQRLNEKEHHLNIKEKELLDKARQLGMTTAQWHFPRV